MAEGIVARRWGYRALYLGLCLFIVFVRLLPLDAGSGGLPGPDLILCLTFAWVLRRPSYVPLGLVALVLLTTDVLFLRPLGLWAGIGVVAYEVLRQREATSRDLTFPLEWAMIAGVVVSMTVANALILALFAAPQPVLGLTLLQMIMTVLAYPLVVLFSSALLGVRKSAPGEVDRLGHRL
jgi:rod shape-determining protein MreD